MTIGNAKTVKELIILFLECPMEASICTDDFGLAIDNPNTICGFDIIKLG